MASLPDYYLSPEEYLAAERRAEFKSEYVEGVVYAMSGASVPHNLIVANLIITLGSQLRGGPCRVFPSDLKVHVPFGRNYFYPDVSIVCGEIEFFDEQRDVIQNPIVIIEVLSESTAAFDRGKKFQSYQQIESLKEYLLVSQDEQVVEHYLRRDDGHWLYTKIGRHDESIELPNISCRLSVRDIYNNVPRPRSSEDA
jgi:Uma2 family endonuclease